MMFFSSRSISSNLSNISFFSINLGEKRNWPLYTLTFPVAPDIGSTLWASAFPSVQWAQWFPTFTSVLTFCILTERGWWNGLISTITGGEGDCFEQMVRLQSNCVLRWGLQLLLTRKGSSEREGPGAGQSGCLEGLTYQCVIKFSRVLLFWSPGVFAKPSLLSNCLIFFSPFFPPVTFRLWNYLGDSAIWLLINSRIPCPICPFSFLFFRSLACTLTLPSSHKLRHHQWLPAAFTSKVSWSWVTFHSSQFLGWEFKVPFPEWKENSKVSAYLLKQNPKQTKTRSQIKQVNWISQTVTNKLSWRISRMERTSEFVHSCASLHHIISKCWPLNVCLDASHDQVLTSSKGKRLHL